MHVVGLTLNSSQGNKPAKWGVYPIRVVNGLLHPLLGFDQLIQPGADAGEVEGEGRTGAELLD